MMKNSEAHKFVGEDIMLVQSAWNASHVLAHGLFSGNPMLDTSQGGHSTNAGDNLGVVRFPCPWQQLNPQERARRAGIPDIKYAGPLLPFKRGHWSTAKWLTEYGEAASGQSPPEHPARPGWRPGQSILFAGAEMGIFEIGWDLHTNEEICAAFAQWVSQNRPTEMPTPDRRGQRLYDIKVALRRLGIMRLLHRCPLSQMAGWCPAAWKRYGKFEWFKERKRAGETFRKLIDFVPAPENPLSWPTAGSGAAV